ncbi:MAG TPA: CPXCG motif-containing cysteine-rich protein [Longimicrobiaceae bacterium]|nr:CPXCG motif-containing cysteine-rich protein [Longimicrobiaceae bacterium]
MIRLNDSAPDDFLDEAFPLGDGTAGTGATVRCPYCWEPNDIALDPGSGTLQEYVEDCQVCCRPWTVRVAYGEDGSAEVVVDAADEA